MLDVKTVYVEEQLEALPEGAILRDKDGDAWQKQADEGFWCVAGEGAALCAADYVASFAPLRVLWEGGFNG